MAFGRTWLYHRDYPDGKIFEDKEEYDQAVAGGWKEAPWLVTEQGVRIIPTDTVGVTPEPMTKRAPGRPKGVN